LSIINYRDGVREGSCKYFYNYGEWAILSESNYKNGKLIGAFKSYYKNSQLEKKGSINTMNQIYIADRMELGNIIIKMAS